MDVSGLGALHGAMVRPPVATVTGDRGDNSIGVF